MKLAGFLLLFAGWAIVLAAMLLLRTVASQGAFTLAGLGVEALGLGIVIRTHLVPHGDRR